MKLRAAASLLVILFASAVFAQVPAVWDPELQVKLKAVGSPRVSPDGKRVVYTVSEAVMTADKSEYVTQIWMANVDAKQNLQLTFGEKSSSNPKWSPDGNWVGFHRLADSVAMLAPSAGGEARILWDGHAVGLTPLNTEWVPGDPNHVIIHTVDKDLRHAFWSVPISSGAPRLVLDFENTALQPRRGEFCTDGRRLYFTVSSDESDVWMMELRKP